MNNRFTEGEIKELAFVRDRIFKGHQICGGTGFNEPLRQDCDCMVLFKYIKELYWSRIPEDYWLLEAKTLKIEKIYKGFLNKYISNIDNAVNNGLGMMYCGVKRGIGKTSSMCVIGKEAVQHGYRPFYVLAQNIIDDRFTKDQDVLAKVMECDMLLIDELDKVMMRIESNIPKQLENLLRGTLPNKKPTIICTNFTEDEVEERFQIISLIKRYMAIIPMDGEDYSDKLAEKWQSRLTKKDLDHWDPVLVRESQRFKGTKIYEQL